MQHEEFHERMDQEIEGLLSEPERQRLAAHLEECADCRAERARLIELSECLAADRVSVREGFAAAVMAALPAAGWEARSPHTWRWPVAILLLLGSASAALVGLSAADLAPQGPLAAALSAITDLLGSAVLAGAGLLTASWRGLGFGLAELLAGSRSALLALALGVVGLNLLLWRLLRHPARAARAARRTTSLRRLG